MSSNKDIYSQLAKDWGLPGSQSFIRIMESGFTPDEGEVLRTLTWWMTPQQLAQKMNVDESALLAKLQSLLKSGWVRIRRGTFNATPNMLSTIPMSSLPGIPEAKLNEIWKDFYRSGDFQKWSAEAWITRLAATGYPVHRVIPARKALRASSNLKPEQILWYEDMEQLLTRARIIFGGRGKEVCNCRRKWGVCDSPVGCMSWSYDERPLPHSRYSHQLTNIEALALVDEAEEYGNVNIPDNYSVIDATCFCCPCCCHTLQSSMDYGRTYKQYGKLQAGTAPSRFQPVIDRDLCNGCQNCIGRCHFEAIEMKKTADARTLKANIIVDNCMGCGLCVFKCPQKAIRLGIVRPPAHIPMITKQELFSWDLPPAAKT